MFTRQLIWLDSSWDHTDTIVENCTVWLRDAGRVKKYIVNDLDFDFCSRMSDFIDAMEWSRLLEMWPWRSSMALTFDLDVSDFDDAMETSCLLQAWHWDHKWPWPMLTPVDIWDIDEGMEVPHMLPRRVGSVSSSLSDTGTCEWRNAVTWSSSVVWQFL